MPKKKHQETQEEQSKRFREAVQEAVAAGKLNPTDADAAFDQLMDLVSAKKPADGAH